MRALISPACGKGGRARGQRRAKQGGACSECGT